MSTTDQLQTDGQRLAVLFDKLKASTGMNRAQFARKYNVRGGASMISQQISGHRPISLEAAGIYMKGFGCTLKDISPSLAASIPQSAIADPAPPPTAQADLFVGVPCAWDGFID